jgi:enterochelin esterase-like enzyme
MKILAASALSTLLLSPAVRLQAQNADVPTWQQPRNVPHGVMHRLEYQSKSINKAREAIVYLPPGYDDGTERYPVLYLLHGAGGDESVWNERMQANVILDNLIAEGELAPLVVVMPHGFTNRIPTDDRPRTAAAYKPEMEEFAADFVGDLVPLVESRYRVVADRAHRAIAGNSMGAGQALRLGFTHPEMFSGVASFSAAMQIANSPAWGGIDMDAALANAAALNELDLLWIGCGTEDSLFSANQQFSEQLTAAGIEHTFRSTPGAHTPAVWSRYLHEVAPQLFPERRAPSP